MPERPIINVGDRVRDLLGHWYLVIDGGPWQFRVQPLAVVGVTERPIGPPIFVGRSDLRASGE